MRVLAAIAGGYLQNSEISLGLFPTGPTLIRDVKNICVTSLRFYNKKKRKDT